MGDEQKTKATAVISTRTALAIREEIDDECHLRGHTRSQALEQIIKLGFPKYLKRFPRKFERLDGKAA